MLLKTPDTLKSPQINVLVSRIVNYSEIPITSDTTNDTSAETTVVIIPITKNDSQFMPSILLELLFLTASE